MFALPRTTNANTHERVFALPRNANWERFGVNVRTFGSGVCVWCVCVELNVTITVASVELR